MASHLRPPARPAARLLQLTAGLALFGLSLAMMVRAELGLGPWDVLHQGLARRLHVEIGCVVIGVSALVLVAWVPLRQRPGIGTVMNAAFVGLFVNAALIALPTPGAWAIRVGLLAGGILLNAVATAAYIGAGLGPGPRDGLMTGLTARGYPVHAVRTAIELSVLACGWLLGGSVGPGTVIYAMTIGPLLQRLLPRLRIAGSLPDRGHPHSKGRVQPCHCSE